jgi:excisionase family DNA binding protein
LLLALGDADCLLTVAEVARRLRVSRATVYKLVAKGKLPHVRIGNSIRFPSDIEPRALKNRPSVPPSSEP